MQDVLPYTLGAFFLAGALLFTVLKMQVGNNRQTPNVKAKALMTAPELAFFRLLKASAVPLHVAPQVAMGAMLQPARGDRSEQRGARNKFSQKIVDFILIDDDGALKLIVQLDDRTHGAAKDADRDAMTAQAGYRTLRIRSADARDVSTVRTMIDLALTPAAALPDAGAGIRTLRGM